MSYRDLTPEDLRAIGDGEQRGYVAMLFTPELLALLLEEKTSFEGVQVVGVGQWSGQVLYDPESKKNVPVVTWHLRRNASEAVPGPEAAK